MLKDTQIVIPGNYGKYTDKYFLRTTQILERDGINLYVRYKVFARKGEEVEEIDIIMCKIENHIL